MRSERSLTYAPGVVSARDAFVDTAAFSRAREAAVGETRPRARPLAPDDRRLAILDAVIPLLKERGRDASTREMAQAAGVAEGTLFRVFDDKESIIRAAVDRYLEPHELRAALESLDPADPTEVKVRRVLDLLRARFEGVIGLMSALGMHGPPPGREHRPHEEEWRTILHRLFADDDLAVPVDDLVYFVRLVAFAGSIPMFSTPHPFTTEQLADLILRGVLPSSGRTA